MLRPRCNLCTAQGHPFGWIWRTSLVNVLDAQVHGSWIISLWSSWDCSMNSYIGTCLPCSIFLSPDLREAFTPPGLLPKWVFMGSQILLNLFVSLFVCLFVYIFLHIPLIWISVVESDFFVTYCYITTISEAYNFLGLGLLFLTHGSVAQEFRHRIQWRWLVSVPGAWGLPLKIWELETRIIWRFHVAAAVGAATVLATATPHSLSPCVGSFRAAHPVFRSSLTTPGKDMVESKAWCHFGMR
jgi:hypothetical protein